MIKGLIYAICACFIWGFLFIIPDFMGEFTSFEIVVGRFFVFGLISSMIVMRGKVKNKGLFSYPFSIWLKASLFSLASTFGSYLFLTLAVRRISPSICALLFGISPITIALYGNWKEKECSYKKFIIPFSLISVGLVCINIPYLKLEEAPLNFFLGLFCCFFGLAAWSWYVAENSRFLKRNPAISSSTWSTLVGATTFFWVVIFVTVFALFQNDFFDIHKLMTVGPSMSTFFMGSLFLGIFCSWIAYFFWNKASTLLPLSFVGQLLLFETFFGVLLSFVVRKHIPVVLEFIGMTLLLSAVLFNMRGLMLAPICKKVEKDPEPQDEFNEDNFR
jgi:drug/metabolite transporter (DMT)-like permease